MVRGHHPQWRVSFHIHHLVLRLTRPQHTRPTKGSRKRALCYFLSGNIDDTTNATTHAGTSMPTHIMPKSIWSSLPRPMLASLHKKNRITSHVMAPATIPFTFISPMGINVVWAPRLDQGSNPRYIGSQIPYVGSYIPYVRSQSQLSTQSAPLCTQSAPLCK